METLVTNLFEVPTLELLGNRRHRLIPKLTTTYNKAELAENYLIIVFEILTTTTMYNNDLLHLHTQHETKTDILERE